MTKVPRNSPCPCGSGKKYKKCCLIKSITLMEKPNEIEFFGDHNFISGKSKEKEINEIIEKGMLEDFVFKNPIDEESSKEICDALILFDDTLVIFQIKSTKVPEKQAYKIIDKGILQARGARRFILRNKSIKIVNERQGEIELRIENIKKIISIVVLSAKEQEYLGRMICVEDELSIHLFDDMHLKEVINVLDTPPDFIEYLLKRETFLKEYQSIFCRELDLLGLYLHNGHKFKLPEGAHEPNQIILDYFWRDKYPELDVNLNEMAQENEICRYFEFILNDAHRCTGEKYIQVATEMAKFNRLQRREASRCIYSTGLKAIVSRQGKYGAIHFRDSKMIFIILFSGMERETRILNLKSFMALLCYKYKCETALGVATEIPPEKPIKASHTFDYLSLNLPWQFNPEMEEIIKKIDINSEDHDFKSL
jgi:hypothetical protein